MSPWTSCCEFCALWQWTCAKTSPILRNSVLVGPSKFFLVKPAAERMPKTNEGGYMRTTFSATDGACLSGPRRDVELSKGTLPHSYTNSTGRGVWEQKHFRNLNMPPQPPRWTDTRFFGNREICFSLASAGSLSPLYKLDIVTLAIGGCVGSIFSGTIFV